MARTPNRSRQTLELLSVLSRRATAWHHGYELAKLTGLKSGTLYPLLKRLHEQELLEDRWEPSEGAGYPPRHAYRLSAAGRALAREATAELRLQRLARPVFGT